MIKRRHWKRYDSFGSRLRECRESKGWSRRELAEKVKINTSSVDQYECDGTNPSLFITADIAKVLGTSIDYLVFGKE